MSFDDWREKNDIYEWDTFDDVAKAAYNAGLEQQVADLTAERDRLRKALQEIREVWAGSDGFVAETAPEAYQRRLLVKMYDLSVKALEDSQ